MLSRLFIRINNAMTGLRRVCVPADSLLLLVPHCLQRSACKHNVAQDVEACRRCGECDIAGLLKLRDRYGLQCNLAGGGRQAVASVKDRAVRAVVAVACEKELCQGIWASFPKPVRAVVNERPNGPCRDTRVCLEEVEQAVLAMLDQTAEAPLASA